VKKTILAIFLAVFSSVWAADIVNFEGEWSFETSFRLRCPRVCGDDGEMHFCLFQLLNLG
jgi:hypothetical protein